MSTSGFSDWESSRSSRGSWPPEHSPYGPKTKIPNNWRSVTINCNGVSGKRAELANLVSYTDPDVLILTETKLDHTVHPSEFLPEGYSCAARKDRNRSGGGVMLAFKSYHSVEEIALDDIDAETTWASVLVNKCQKLVIGVFYRLPDHRTHQVEQLEKTLFQITTKFMNNPNTTFMLSGDFNTGDINWDLGTVSPISNQKAVNDLVLSISQQFDLTQLQREPTRLDNLLDLFFTNKPTLMKSVTAIPGISDHEIVLADCDIKPTRNKRTPRYIHQWRKADWEKLKSETVAFRNNFLEESSSRSVSETYTTFKKFIQTIINKHIPKRLLKIGKHNLPWITPNIRRLWRKKQRLFNKAKRSHSGKDWQEYKSHKKHTLQSIRRAHWNYVNSILQEGLESNDSKPFWRFIKSKQQDTVGVSPLEVDGQLHSEATDKADILNKQFKSVFTPPQSAADNIPKLSGPKTPLISPLKISTKGVEKLLAGLNVKKASGPDNIPCKILRELAAELAPILTTIFQQSLETGQIPGDSTLAFVSPIFKKGNRNLPVNYRPVSLTSVPCKIMEHIICSHVRDHLDKHSVLTSLQHGFREAHSCETQLHTTLQDLL